VTTAPSHQAADQDQASYAFRPIGILRSCYTDKFGIPRQPGLVTAAEARLELYPAYAREEAFRDLEGFSHVWLIFVFHDCLGEGWRPTVRPPRLGGRRKVGVFASRSPYRPNPIGISAVELVGLVRDARGLALGLRGVDLLDGTPVLDVKPYVPYADAIPEAAAGFAPQPPGREWAVEITADARRQIAAADPDGALRLEPLIAQILRQDPRPGYMDRYPERTAFGMRLYHLEVQWRVTAQGVQVTAVTPVDG
jgi:tRNA-Thr(GGU) m(6)t(6)A37 methyltransferase TsaA